MRRMTFAVILLMSILFVMNTLTAEEIGIGWEFNENGNAQGWKLQHSLTDLQVADGMLRATVTGDFAQLVGPDFDLDASNYGSIQIRMKAILAKSEITRWKVRNAKTAVLQWVGENGNWGFFKFDVMGDSLFHVYDIPAYQKSEWKGRVTGISRITMDAKVGSKIEIDYIRITRVGARPEVASFAPVRTVLISGEQIPFMAVVKNSGDKDGAMRVSLSLPAEFEIMDGNTAFDLGTLARGDSATLRWSLLCNTIGDYQLKLQMTSADSDTALFDLPVSVVDRYWHQDKFLLSAWSPPSLVDSSFDYYHKANFDLMLWVPPTEEAVALVAKYRMKCLLSVGGLFGGGLSTPHGKIPPPLTAAQFSLLDDVIEKFKNDPTVVGYFITDEPWSVAFPNIGQIVAYLRAQDPDRFCYINIVGWNGNGGGNYDSFIQQLLEVVKPEILSYDHYIFYNGFDDGSYFSNIATIRKWALRYDVPFYNIVQAMGTNDTNMSSLNWRTPSEAEHRWQAYSSLAYGAKGIVWFHWDADWGVIGSPDRDQIYASLKKLNAEIKSIGPVMIQLKSVAVYHSHVSYGGVPLPEGALVKSVSANADLVVGLFKDDADQDYAMLMNKNYHDSVTATITLNRSVQSLKYFNVDSTSWQGVDYENANEGTVFESTFRAGGGKLFAIGEETVVEKHGKIISPQEFYLEQNYPNPFNPQTTIEYEISQNVKVKLSVHDVLGREVAVLVDKRQQVGAYQVVWNAAHFPSGIYFYTLRVGTQVKRRKMLLLR